MSRIKSAEEWNTLHTIVPKDVNYMAFWMIYDLAESYADYVLKARLESITDEVIQNKAYDYSVIGMEISSFMDGSEWLKQKLLKDESK